MARLRSTIFGRTSSTTTGGPSSSLASGSRRLEVGRLGVERHQRLEDPVVHRQLDDRPARGVPAHDVAVLEEVVQQRAGLDVLEEAAGARWPWQWVRFLVQVQNINLCVGG